MTFPVWPLPLGLLLAGYAVLIWLRPQAILIALPAALALFDLAPWSGRFYIDEFDFLVLLSVAIGYARVPPALGRGKRDPAFFLAAALLGLAYAIGSVRGLLPWQMPDANAFTSYYSPYNALRIAKGVLWAFLLYGLLGRLASAGVDVRRLFARGMVLGLAGTVMVVLWERAAFPGLINFADVYRVTGPFSQMHIGGADIETYLALAAPFLVLLIFEQRSWAARVAGMALLVGATYAIMVTFSRVGYVGFGAALAFALFAAWTRHAGTRPLKAAAAALALAVIVLAVAIPIFLGPFAQGRMSLVGGDLATRAAHWADALQMRDPDWATSVLGMGIGRYPETHSWRSREVHAATYRLATEGDNAFLQLGSGSPLYVEQFVGVEPQQDYVLSLDARSDRPGARVTVSLCEKWLLTSARCVFQAMGITGRGEWQPVRIHLPSGEVGSGAWFASRPVKLSLYNANADAVVDVDNMHLQAVDASELLANRDFSQGLDRWFFSVDNDRPWHVWSLPVQILFDQGWLGLAALGPFAGLALWRAGRDAWKSDAVAGAMLAASLAFIVIGSLDSLVDSPRLLLLFLLLGWFSARGGKCLRETSTQ